MGNRGRWAAAALAAGMVGAPAWAQDDPVSRAEAISMLRTDLRAVEESRDRSATWAKGLSWSAAGLGGVGVVLSVWDAATIGEDAGEFLAVDLLTTTLVAGSVWAVSTPFRARRNRRAAEAALIEEKIAILEARSSTGEE